MAHGRLRLYHFIPATRTEGPGLRAGIWVQGCSRRCPGCAAPETWDFEGGYVINTDELVERILAVPDLDGITIAGGEPFCQAGELARLARLLRKMRPMMSVLCFSGWRLEELRELHLPAVNALLDETDLLIDGPYVEGLACTNRPLVGSSNQKYHFLTSKLLSWKEEWHDEKNRIEIRISTDGCIGVNGMLPGKILQELMKRGKK